MINDSLEHLLKVQQSLNEYQEKIYNLNGYVVIKKFLLEPILNEVVNFWTNPEIDYYFADKIANRDVNEKSPPYMYYGKTNLDKSHCTGMWNRPLDDLTHDLALKVTMIRNLISGQPLYHGLGMNSEWVNQYRVCKTVSNGEAVKKHSDFMEEFRSDPTGSHLYDPSRLQATLALSSPGKDFRKGGFYLVIDGKEVFTSDLGVDAGDLILWRYNLGHGVKDVAVSKSEDLGFMRIIYPSFQIG